MKKITSRCSVQVAFVLFACAVCNAEEVSLEAYKEWLTDGYKVNINVDRFLNGEYIGYDVSLPFDWACTNISDRSICYRMHGFLLLDAIRYKYEANRDVRCGKFLHDYVMDWLGANPVPLEGNAWAWHDDATARRVQRLSYYYRFIPELWDDVELKKIKVSLDSQAKLLATDSFYKPRHNHGMYQDFGLICYSLCVCDNDVLRKKYMDKAISRSLQYFEYSFCPNGVHREHSPAYARDTAMAALHFSKIVKPYNVEMAVKYENYWLRSKRFLVLCTMPNGILPSMGDSSVTKSGYEPETATVLCDEKTGGGYAIFRSSWYDMPKSATWMIFQAATFSSVHKHGDDLAFLLYHKGELFVEAGNRNYNYADPMTAYAYSGYAHNVLCVDDMDFPVNVNPKSGFRSVPKAAMNTYITKYSIDGEVKEVTGVQKRFPGIVQTRTLSYDKKGKVVVVLDEFDANRKFKASLLFHVAEGVAVTSDGGVLRFSRKGHPVATMSIESVLPVNVRVLHGEGKAPYHAWIFNGGTEPKSGSLVVVDAMCGAGKSAVTARICLQ